LQDVGFLWFWCPAGPENQGPAGFSGI